MSKVAEKLNKEVQEMTQMLDRISAPNLRAGERSGRVDSARAILTCEGVFLASEFQIGRRARAGARDGERLRASAQKGEEGADGAREAEERPGEQVQHLLRSGR